MISKNTLEDIITKTAEADGTSNGTEDEAATNTEGNNCLREIQAIRRLVQTAIDSNKGHEKEDRTRFRVTSDDAVEVLSDVKVDDSHITDAIKPKAYGTMLTKRSYNDSNNGNSNNYPRGYDRDTRSKMRIPNGEGPKARSKCRACGEPNHWYKDPECIYNVMRNIVEGKEVTQDVVNKQNNEVQALFNKANNSRSKVAISDIVDVIGPKAEPESSDKDYNAKANKAYFR